MEKATGLPGLTMQVLGVMPWEVIVHVADRYREGRIFLVGDAAHTTTPWGGLGGNTGIQDAHNIAWKLAAVVCGRADPALLDSYELERQPVAELTIRHALAKMHRENTPTDDATISLGYRYRAGALLPEDDGDDDDEALFEDRSSKRVKTSRRARHCCRTLAPGRESSRGGTTARSDLG